MIHTEEVLYALPDTQLSPEGVVRFAGVSENRHALKYYPLPHNNMSVVPLCFYAPLRVSDLFSVFFVEFSGVFEEEKSLFVFLAGA